MRKYGFFTHVRFAFVVRISVIALILGLAALGQTRAQLPLPEPDDPGQTITTKLRWTIPGLFGYGYIDVSPDGQYIAASCFRNNQEYHSAVHLWTANTGVAVKESKDYKWGCYGIVFSADSKQVAVASGDGLANIHTTEDLKPEHILFTKGGENGFFDLAFSPDNKYVAAVGTAKARVYLWNAENGKLEHVWENKQPKECYLSVCFSPDGSKLVAGNVDNTVTIWNVSDGKEESRLTGLDASVCCVHFSPDGKLFAAAASNGDLKVWDAKTYKLLRTINVAALENISLQFVFSPDSTMIATAGGSLKLWDTNTGTLLRVIADYSGLANPPFAYKPQFGPDSTLLYCSIKTSNTNGTYDIKVWRLTKQ